MRPEGVTRSLRASCMHPARAALLALALAAPGLALAGEDKKPDPHQDYGHTAYCSVATGSPDSLCKKTAEQKYWNQSGCDLHEGLRRRTHLAGASHSSSVRFVRCPLMIPIPIQCSL